MFDSLLEEDPWFQEKVAQRVLQRQGEWEAKGHAEGYARGIMKSSRSILVKVVQMRFPSSGHVAEVAAAQIADFEILEALIEQMIQATSESQALFMDSYFCRCGQLSSSKRAVFLLSLWTSFTNHAEPLASRQKRSDLDARGSAWYPFRCQIVFLSENV